MQPAVRGFKDDKDNYPDTKDAQSKNEQALQQAYERSHGLGTLEQATMINLSSGEISLHHNDRVLRGLQYEDHLSRKG